MIHRFCCVLTVVRRVFFSYRYPLLCSRRDPPFLLCSHRGSPCIFYAAVAVPVAQLPVQMVAPGPVMVMNRNAVQEHVVYNSIIEDYLTQSEGLLVREKLWLSQVLCGACEKQVQFKVAQYDTNVSDAATDEEFTSRPAQFMVKEQSECCQRYCFHQARHLKLGVFPMGGTMHSTGEQVRFTIFDGKVHRVVVVFCLYNVRCPLKL